MLFEATINQRSSIFNAFEIVQVEADSAEIAGAFALSETKKKYRNEKDMYVSKIVKIGDKFIGHPPKKMSRKTG